MATPLANSTEPSVPTQAGPLIGGMRTRGIIGENNPGHPLVTVITATFNAKHHIAECLDSVISQDYPNIEHLILDGGSSDGTTAVLRQYDDRIAFWKSEPDKGIYDAWNKGLAKARGEWICFLGADDEFLPQAVSAYMALAVRYPDAEYISSQVRWVDPSGYVNPRHGRAWKWSQFSKRMSVAHPGSMHRRSLFDRLGKYDDSYRSAADYELLLRAGSTLKAAYLPSPTALMRGGGMSDNSVALIEAYRAKTCTAGRNRAWATLELWEVQLRFKLLPLYRAASRLLAQSR